MQKKKVFALTPLMRISIIWTLGIIVGHSCYEAVEAWHWLVATLLTWGLSTALHLHHFPTAKPCISLSLCIFFLGAYLTSHEMDKQQETLQVISGEKLSSLDLTLLKTRDFRSQALQKLKSLNLEGQDIAVISAMTLGDKTALSKETKDIYSISGASHVLAVSGLHIGIIFQLFILLLGRKKRSIYVIMLTITAIWTYVVLIGTPASAVRSATLITICCFALIAHRESLSTSNLAFAYIVMLFIDPLYLYDISFQMSFTAVFSILLFAPILQSHLNATTGLSKWIGGMLYLSLAAQIGTIPLIVYYFGRISCYSLLTSFIAIPAATCIIWLSAIVFLLATTTTIPGISLFTDFLLNFTASCLSSLTQTCNTALQLTTMLPGANIEGLRISLSQLFLIYTCIAIGYILWKKLR